MARGLNGRANIDGRSLRATGRTEQFNFKALPGLAKAAKEAATAQGVTIAEWMQDAIAKALQTAKGRH